MTKKTNSLLVFIHIVHFYVRFFHKKIPHIKLREVKNTSMIVCKSFCLYI